MKLWTIQPPEVVEILRTEGVFRCDEAKAEWYEDLCDAYQWLVREMDKRNIPHPEGVTLPIWAWHTRDWKHKKPDFRTIGLGTPGKQYACIEFEIPDNKVLLSDYDNWHYVLNGGWFDDSKNENDWNTLHEWYDLLPYDAQKDLMVKSWQKIFDVTPVKDKWCSKGQYVQATFWELKQDMVCAVKYFTAR